MIKTHKDLEVWKIAIAFTTDIYKATQTFPKAELYGLVTQLRRAAVSIASNIAEGAARQSRKEYLHFLYCALGSSSEIETQLLVAMNLEYLEEPIYHSLSFQQTKLSKMLSGLIGSIRKKL